MANNADRVDVSRYFEEQNTHCVQGHEIFSPRDLTVFLRMQQEEGKKLPPELVEHLAECTTCAENWEFIQRTDPILKKFRRDRVKLLITSVLADEATEVEEAAAAAILQKPSEKIGEDQPELVQAMEQVLAQPQTSWRSDAIGQLLQRVLAGGQLTSDTVLATCRAVQGIADDADRYEASIKVSAGFGIRVDREQQRGTISNDSIMDRLMGRRGWVDLSTLGVPVEKTMVFLASLPQVSYFRDPDLFQQSDKTISFHVGRLPELLSEWETLGGRIQKLGTTQPMD